jgi:hypothetical protein
MPHFDWLHSDSLPDGHRLFYTPSIKDVAIADDSGDKPEDTDDGVRWLDFDEPLSCKPGLVGGEPFHTLCRIPIKDKYGHKTYTISNAPAILELSAAFQWQINVSGTLYKAERI